jgi:hypothetical protein
MDTPFRCLDTTPGMQLGLSKQCLVGGGVYEIYSNEEVEMAVREYSRTPLIRIGVALRLNLSRILQN